VVLPDPRKQWNANAPAWTELSRAGFDVYRDLINTPAFFALLPDVDGLLGLDLGCGEGHNTRLLAKRGAEMVAIDVSEVFIEAAAAEGRARIRYLLGDGAVLPFAGETLDFVAALMSLMDVGDPEACLRETTRVLKPGGFVQFSVTHPVSGTRVRRWVNNEAGEREALAVGDYFYEGPLTETWIFGAAPAQIRERHAPFTITYARRTVTGWLNAVLHAGLTIEAIDEPQADEAMARSHPEVADTRIVPYFLLIRARKPSAQAAVGQ
jgi:SAM-dependent methyltransferase